MSLSVIERVISITNSTYTRVQKSDRLINNNEREREMRVCEKLELKIVEF